MEFKTAEYVDYERVAYLHADSLKRHYSKILSRRYLQNDVQTEKLALWQTRLTNPPFGQHVILAEEGGLLLGFACVFGNHDFELGTFIDSLHVDGDFQRRGIGKKLLQEVANWQQHYFPERGLYLEVNVSNRDSIEFYQSIGGTLTECRKRHASDGTEMIEQVITWPSAEKLSAGLLAAVIFS